MQGALIIPEHGSTETSNNGKHCVEPQSGVHLCDITFQNLTQKRNNE